VIANGPAGTFETARAAALFKAKAQSQNEVHRHPAGPGERASLPGTVGNVSIRDLQIRLALPTCAVMDFWLVVGTWALALATWALVVGTWLLGRRQLEGQRQQLEGQRQQLEGQLSIAQEQLRVQRQQIEQQLSVAREELRVAFYLDMRKQFDGPLLSERRLLAQQLKAGALHNEINERVPDFFDDLGMLIRRDYIDHDMVWDTFSYCAKGWWTACKDYIATERANKGGDTTLFSDFGNLVESIYADEMKKRGRTRAELELSTAEVQDFLDDETRL
jgi:hypothetical protein